MPFTTNGHAPILPELFRDDALRIETRRLWLRWPARADAPALHEIASLEAVARHTATWPHPFPEGEALRRIERARAVSASGVGLILALALKARPGELIGTIGIVPEAAGGPLSLGYLLSVERQGVGLMTEAVRALVGTVFRYSGAQRICGASGGPVDADAMELTRDAWLGRVPTAGRGPRAMSCTTASAAIVAGAL